MTSESPSTLAPELQTLGQQVHAFARDVLRPAAMNLDPLAVADVIAPESQLWHALRCAYARKLHTALVPTDCGGMGLQGMALHVALEELGWGSSDFAISLCAAGFPFSMAAGTGNPKLIDEFVRPFVADREARLVGCWGLTEPGHGSDHFMPGSPEFHDAKISGELIAKREGEDLILSGGKAVWISNGTIATHALLHVSLEPARGLAGGGAAIVPLNLPGISKGEPLDKLGQRALNQGPIAFDRVRIPGRYLLVDIPAYEGTVTGILALTNAIMGAVFTGVARAAFEEARDHVRTRIQGGKRLCEHQLVQKRIFDMSTKVEASRELSRTALVAAAGKNPRLDLSISSKVFCTQSAFEVADSAVQLLGGRGLSKGCLVEKLFRDARAALIEDGSNDILALVGGQSLLAQA